MSINIFHIYQNINIINILLDVFQLGFRNLYDIHNKYLDLFLLLEDILDKFKSNIELENKTVNILTLFYKCCENKSSIDPNAYSIFYK